MSRFKKLIVLAAAACLLWALPVPVAAQPADEDLTRRLQILRDFEHYTRIHQIDMAAAKARELLGEAMTPAEWVSLVEATRDVDRFQETLNRAQGISEIEPLAGQMQIMYRRGKLEQVRDPDEIQRNIELLTGTHLQRRLGTERLVAAGEYAMPQLLEAFLEGEAALAAEVGRVMQVLGRQAIIPLTTALLDLPPASQERVVRVLGRIPYPTSLPFLAELRETTDHDAVRAAAVEAIRRIAGDRSPAADLYHTLAEGYYRERSDLTSFPGEGVQLLWTYDPSVGLHARAIRTEVFHEAMAMDMAERSLRLQRENPDAVALWVAANIRRELESPDGYINPAYPPDRRSADYYAIASGADICQRVLAVALDDRNTRLVRRAISALDRTAGREALWASLRGGRSPLLESLRYRDRRVQYEASLALGKASPAASFDGSDRVVPMIASMVRHADERYAVVIAGTETAKARRESLEAMGYTVLPEGRALSEVAGAIAEVPAVDLILSDLPPGATERLIAEVRATPLLGATPVVVLVEPVAVPETANRFGRDGAVSVRAATVSQSELRASIEGLIDRAAGGRIDAGEARRYQALALEVLRDLAVSDGTVYDVSDATRPLVRALDDARSPFRQEIAEVLSWIGLEQAQVAIMDAALAAEGQERIMFLGKAAASAKRYGNMLADRQIRRVIEIGATAPEPEATAAAALLGSLNLPNERLVPMILGAQN